MRGKNVLSWTCRDQNTLSVIQRQFHLSDCNEIPHLILEVFLIAIKMNYHTRLISMLIVVLQFLLIINFLLLCYQSSISIACRILVLQICWNFLQWRFLIFHCAWFIYYSTSLSIWKKALLLLLWQVVDVRYTNAQDLSVWQKGYQIHRPLKYAFIIDCKFYSGVRWILSLLLIVVCFCCRSNVCKPAEIQTW